MAAEPRIGLFRERRRSRRFPIEGELRYRTLGRRSEILSGKGKTLNISSSGILFTAGHSLPVGTPLEVSMNWPFHFCNEKCMINLVARGHIARESCAALSLRVRARAQ
jgi:PilZ domain